MPIIWPAPVRISQEHRARLEPALKLMGVGTASLSALIVPSLAMDGAGVVRRVGRQFLILDAAANPVALARNAYGRWFPKVQGSAPARRLESQVGWLRAQPAPISADLFGVAYLSAVITYESCIALYAGRSNHVVNVVRVDRRGTFRLQSLDYLAGDVRRSAAQRKDFQVSMPRNLDFPSN